MIATKLCWINLDSVAHRLNPRPAVAAMVRTLKEQIQKLRAENQGLRQHMEEVVGRTLYADEQAEHYKREAEQLRTENIALQQQLTQFKQPAVEPSDRSLSAASTTTSSPQQDAQQKIKQELAHLGVEVNSTLSRSIRSTDEQTVLIALEALEEALETEAIKNPAG